MELIENSREDFGDPTDTKPVIPMNERKFKKGLFIVRRLNGVEPFGIVFKTIVLPKYPLILLLVLHICSGTI